MSGMTIVVGEDGSESTAELVLKSSRKLYVKKIEETAEAEIFDQDRSLLKSRVRSVNQRQIMRPKKPVMNYRR